MNKKIRIFFSRLVIVTQLVQLLSPAIVLAADNMCNVNPGTCSTQQDWERGWGAARQPENAGAVPKQDEWTNANDSAPEIIRERGERDDVNRSQKAADAGDAVPVNKPVSDREDAHRRENKIPVRVDNPELPREAGAPAPATAAPVTAGSAPSAATEAPTPGGIYCNYCGGFNANASGGGCRQQAIAKCPDKSGLAPAVVGAQCFNANNTLCGKNGYGTVDFDDNNDGTVDRTEALTSEAAPPQGQKCADGKEPIAGRCWHELPQKPEAKTEAPAAALTAEELRIIRAEEREGLEGEGAAKVDALLMPPVIVNLPEAYRCSERGGVWQNGRCGVRVSEPAPTQRLKDDAAFPTAAATQRPTDTSYDRVEELRAGRVPTPDVKIETETIQVGGGKFGQVVTVTTKTFCSGNSVVTQSSRSDGVESSGSTGCEWGCGGGSCRGPTPEEAQVYRYSVLQNAIEREQIACQQGAGGDSRDVGRCTAAAVYNKAVNNLRPEELSPTIKQAFNDSSWVPDDTRQQLVNQRIEEIRRAERGKPVYVPRLTEEEIRAKAEQFVEETINAGRLRLGASDELNPDSPEYQALVEYAKQNPLITGLSFNKEFTANLFAAGMSGLVTGGEVMGNKLGDQFSPYYQARQVKEEVLGRCGLRGWERRLTPEQGACLRGESLVVKVNNAGLQQEREVNAALQVGTAILATVTGGAGGALAKGAPKLIQFGAEVLPQVGVDLAAAPVFADLYSRETRNRAAIYQALANSGGADQIERAVWDEQARNSAEQAEEQYRQELVNGFITAVVANVGFEAVGRVAPKVLGDSAVGKVLFGSEVEAREAAGEMAEMVRESLPPGGRSVDITAEDVLAARETMAAASSGRMVDGPMVAVSEMMPAGAEVAENYPILAGRTTTGNLFERAGQTVGDAVDQLAEVPAGVGRRIGAAVENVGGAMPSLREEPIEVLVRGSAAVELADFQGNKPLVGVLDDGSVGINPQDGSRSFYPSDGDVVSLGGKEYRVDISEVNVKNRTGKVVFTPVEPRGGVNLVAGGVIDGIRNAAENVQEALPFGRKPAVNLEGPVAPAVKSTAEAFPEAGSVEVVPKGGGEPYRVDYDPNNPQALDSLRPGDTVDDVYGQGWIKNEDGTWSSLGEEVGGGGGGLQPDLKTTTITPKTNSKITDTTIIVSLVGRSDLILNTGSKPVDRIAGRFFGDSVEPNQNWVVQAGDVFTQGNATVKVVTDQSGNLVLEVTSPATKAVKDSGVGAVPISDLSSPQKLKERFGTTTSQTLDAFEKRWPTIVENIKKDIASGITPEKAIENALASLKHGGKLSMDLNDRQVERFFRPDIEEAANIVSSRQAGIVSPETVIPRARESSGFATDPGKDSRYSNYPQKNQDAVGNYEWYVVYDVSPRERIAAARIGKPIQSSIEVRPLHVTPEDLASKGRVYVLSDGVGGNEMPGDIASNFVVESTLFDYYSSDFRPDLTDPAVRMKAVLDEVNSKLVRETNGKSGGTLNAVVALDDKVWVFNVGDSRTYRIDRNGKITLLTTDQSWGNEMVARGKRTPEKVKGNPNATQLWSYMGGVDEHFRIDVQQFPARSGEKYVQISDGILEVLSEEEIANIVMKAKSPQEAAQSLIKAANNKKTFLDGGASITGQRDNISAQVIEIPGEKKGGFFNTSLGIVAPGFREGEPFGPGGWFDVELRGLRDENGNWQFPVGRKSKDTKLNFAPSGEKKLLAAGGGALAGSGFAGQRLSEESEIQKQQSNHRQTESNGGLQVEIDDGIAKISDDWFHDSNFLNMNATNKQIVANKKLIVNNANLNFGFRLGSGVMTIPAMNQPAERFTNQSDAKANQISTGRNIIKSVAAIQSIVNQLVSAAGGEIMPQVYAAEGGGERIMPLSMYRALAGQVLFRKAVEGLPENERTAEKIGEAVLGAAAVANSIPERGTLSSNKAGYSAVSGTGGIAAGAAAKGIYRVTADAVGGLDLTVPEKVNVGVSGDGAVLIGVTPGKGKVKVVGGLEWWEKPRLRLGEWINKKLTNEQIGKLTNKLANIQNGAVLAAESEAAVATVPLTVQLFIDENKNGKMDSGEEPTKLAGVKVELVAETKTISYQLTEGWNFISFPLIPESVKTAAELIQDTALDGGYVTTVATWEQDKWMEFSQRGGQKFGQDFELQSGRAYFLNSHKESTWSLAGTPLPEENRALQLRKGWNGVGIPEQGTTAVQVMDDIQITDNREQRTAGGEAADQVGRWDFGLWDVVVKRRYSPEQHEIYGRDFPIKETEGYFIHANEEVTWTMDDGR